MKRLIAIALCSAALLAAPAASADAGRAEVLEALKGYEVELTRERFARLGPGWEQALLELARDATLKPLWRIRAISALAFVPGEATVETLGAILSAKKAAKGAAELKAALWSLGKLGGERAGALAAPFLEHPVADVRAVAADALAASGAADARALLQKRLPLESDDLVRHALEAGIQKAR